MKKTSVIFLAGCLFSLLIANSASANTSKALLSEKMPNEKLEKVIVDFYQIPEDDLAATHYFYNYVDLNNDGTDEIFTMVTGPYTSGSGGNGALLVEQQGDSLRVKKDFTLVRNPIIVSNKKHHKYHDLVFLYAGGGEKAGYKAVTYKKGNYGNIPDSKDTKKLAGYKILADNIATYAESGLSLANMHNYYTLAEAQQGNVYYPVLTDHKGVLTSDYVNQSLKNTALELMDKHTAMVTYHIMCNDGKILSVLYEAWQNDGSKKLTAVTLEMQRANEIKIDNAFKDLKALPSVLNVEQATLAKAAAYFDGENMVLVYPTQEAATAGYEMRKYAYNEIEPYLQENIKQYFTALK